MTWQADAFGLQLGNYSPESGDTVDHAEMFYGNRGIMFGSSGKPQRRESQFPRSFQPNSWARLISNTQGEWRVLARHSPCVLFILSLWHPVTWMNRMRGLASGLTHSLSLDARMGDTFHEVTLEQEEEGDHRDRKDDGRCHQERPLRPELLE
jgi:hypothetical protein